MEEEEEERSLRFPECNERIHGHSIITEQCQMPDRPQEGCVGVTWQYPRMSLHYPSALRCTVPHPQACTRTRHPHTGARSHRTLHIARGCGHAPESGELLALARQARRQQRTHLRPGELRLNPADFGGNHPPKAPKRSKKRGDCEYQLVEVSYDS